MPLAAHNVSFSFASRPVLNDVTCSLNPGEILAILGPNGVGKTTLLRLLAGVLRPSPSSAPPADQGRIELDGRAVASIPPRDRAGRIASIAQNPHIAFSFSVQQVVALGAFARGTGSPGGIAARSLADVQLADRADEPFASLSAGQRQRAALARALVQLDGRTDAYLLADEPFSAMDPRFSLHSMEILRSLRDRGLGIAIVLHDLTLAARLADSALLLGQDGRIITQGPVMDVLCPEPLRKAFGVDFSTIPSPDGPLLTPRAISSVES